MTREQTLKAATLEANSPFELRVGLGRDVPQNAVKKALTTGDVGFLHSFTTGSTVDGPGVRVVAWTAGCHFKCLYCHNPDTWNMMNGMPVTLDKATEELGKYRNGLKVMGGGLTVSGGEPLMQDRFVARLLTAAKEMGIHTAIDTNGSLGERLNDTELQNIDLVMMCIKAWDPNRHRSLTGREVGPTLDFADRLSALKRPMWLRFVLVPGLTDDEEDIKQLGKFAADLGNVERVDVLPFHQMGRYKWKQLGLDYYLDSVEPPSHRAVEHVCSLFRAEGLKAF
jgi:pyruvate formate lyase activating enzyme